MNLKYYRGTLILLYTHGFTKLSSLYQTVFYCGDDVREVLLPDIVELGPADHTAGIDSHFLRHSLIDPLHGE